jgi:hypothetical protein
VRDFQTIYITEAVREPVEQVCAAQRRLYCLDEKYAVDYESVVIRRAG